MTPPRAPREWKPAEIGERLPIDAMIKLILEAAAKSTPVVGWYAHPAQVRGPFGRWLEITKVLPEYQKYVADERDEAEYAAAVMNFAPYVASAYASLAAELKARNAELDLLKRGRDKREEMLGEYSMQIMTLTKRAEAAEAERKIAHHDATRMRELVMCLTEERDRLRTQVIGEPSTFNVVFEQIDLAQENWDTNVSTEAGFDNLRACIRAALKQEGGGWS